MQINPDMKAGLWMIVQAFKERNYLYAYDIYMRLAVGKTLHCSCLFNAPLLLVYA